MVDIASFGNVAVKRSGPLLRPSLDKFLAQAVFGLCLGFTAALVVGLI